jgi:hypothetical protein
VSAVDPNETLQRLREACRDLRQASSIAQSDDAAELLAEHAESLDEWLTRGGFLPAEWLWRAGVQPDAWQATVWVLTRDVLTSWTGQPLSDEQAERVAEAIPQSSIPEAVATIAASVIDAGPETGQSPPIRHPTPTPSCSR